MPPGSDRDGTPSSGPKTKPSAELAAARPLTKLVLALLALAFGGAIALLVMRPPPETGTPGADASAPALVRADYVALRVALAPLLSRTVVVDSLVVEGANLRLVQTADGIDLPTPSAASPEPEGASSESTSSTWIFGTSVLRAIA